jgi:hypothetical protein
MPHDEQFLREVARQLDISNASCYEPASSLVVAAAADIPVVLSQLEDNPYPDRPATVPAGEKVLPAYQLIRQLAMQGHSHGVASWAIYQLVKRGFLGAESTNVFVTEEKHPLTLDPVQPHLAAGVHNVFVAEGKHPLTLTYARTPDGSLRMTNSTGNVSVLMTLRHHQGDRDSFWPLLPNPPERFITRTIKDLLVWSTPLLRDWWRSHREALPALREETEEVADAAHDCYVTLDKAAAMVGRSKKTLERYKRKMPAPTVKGGRGKPNEWLWSVIRPWLEKTFDRNLPKRFPGDRFR